MTVRGNDGCRKRGERKMEKEREKFLLEWKKYRDLPSGIAMSKKVKKCKLDSNFELVFAVFASAC